MDVTDGVASDGNRVNLLPHFYLLPLNTKYTRIDPSLDLLLQEPQSILEHRLHGKRPPRSIPERPVRHKQLRYWVKPDFQMSNSLDQVRSHRFFLRIYAPPDFV